MTEKRRFSGKKDRKKRASFFPKKTLEKVVLQVAPRRYVAKKLEKPLFPSFLPTLRPALGGFLHFFSGFRGTPKNNAAKCL